VFFLQGKKNTRAGRSLFRPPDRLIFGKPQSGLLFITAARYNTYITGCAGSGSVEGKIL
jgi:hypothetical protein